MVRLRSAFVCAVAALLQSAPDKHYVFDMGQIVVVGSPEGQPGVGGSVLTREQIWTFDRQSLDTAVTSFLASSAPSTPMAAATQPGRTFYVKTRVGL